MSVNIGDTFLVGSNNKIGSFIEENDAPIQLWIEQNSSPLHNDLHLPNDFQGSMVADIFADPQLRRCLGEGGGTVFLKGKMGIGKTTTMIGILHEIDILNANISLARQPPNTGKNTGQEQIAKSKIAAASIFFASDPNKKGRFTASMVLMSIFYQLARALNGSEHVRQMYARHQNVVPTTELITSAIAGVLRGHSNSCILLDALDEANDKELTVLIKRIAHLQQVTGVGLISTHRDSMDCDKYARNFHNVNTRYVRPNKEDIKRYGNERLSELDEDEYPWLRNTKLRNEVEDKIADLSGGIFLLVKLNWSYITDGTEEWVVRKLLGNIEPMTMSLETWTSEHKHLDQELIKEVSKVFDRNVERVLDEGHKPTRRKIALSALGFLRDAVRPVLISEFVGMLRLSLERQDRALNDTPTWKTIQSYCIGLIAEDDVGRANFVHHSFGDYYMRTTVGRGRVPSMHLELAQRCAAYLSLDFTKSGLCTDRASFENRLQAYPTFEYAARYWSEHLLISLDRQVDHIEHLDKHALELTLRFLKDPSRVEAAVQVKLFEDIPLQKSRVRGDKAKIRATLVISKNAEEFVKPFEAHRITGLHLACGIGLMPLLEGLMGPGPSSETNVRDFQGRGPLHYAAIEGHRHVVSYLLGKNANPGMSCRFGATPLFLATISSHNGVFDELWKVRHLIHLNASTQHSIRQETHYMDARLEHDVVRLSLNRSSEYTVSGRTVLHNAAREGNTYVLKQLLGVKDVQRDPRDSEGQTPLHKAAKKGRLDALKMLIEDDFGVDPLERIGVRKDGKPSSEEAEKNVYYRGTALTLASSYERCHEVVKYLLQKYPKLLSMETERGDYPLHAAASEDNNLLVLIDACRIHGLGLDITNKAGRTPLSLAAQWGNSKNVKTLLSDASINANAADNDGWTPLHYATLGGHKDCVGLLLTHDRLEVNAKTRKGLTALALAVNSKEVAVLNKLWNHHGVDKEVLDNKQRKLLDQLLAWTVKD